MAQLFDRVRQTKSLRMEKEYIRMGVKKERVAYVNYIDSVKMDKESFVAGLSYKLGHHMCSLYSGRLENLCF